MGLTSPATTGCRSSFHATECGQCRPGILPGDTLRRRGRGAQLRHLHPADEPLELRTVLLTGDFGTFGETPLRVEVTGPLLTIDGESLLGLSTEDITPLEDGPRVVLAERFAPETPASPESAPTAPPRSSSSPGRGASRAPPTPSWGRTNASGLWCCSRMAPR